MTHWSFDPSTGDDGAYGTLPSTTIGNGDSFEINTGTIQINGSPPPKRVAAAHGARAPPVTAERRSRVDGVLDRRRHRRRAVGDTVDPTAPGIGTNHGSSAVRAARSRLALSFSTLTAMLGLPINARGRGGGELWEIPDPTAPGIGTNHGNSAIRVSRHHEG